MASALNQMQVGRAGKEEIRLQAERIQLQLEMCTGALRLVDPWPVGAQVPVIGPTGNLAER